MSAETRWIELGKIYREWGIRGQLRLLPFNADSEVYPKLKQIYLKGPDSSWQDFPLTQIEKHGRYWLIKLQGYDTPEASRELRGFKVAITRDKLPPLKEGELYLADLEGFEVRTCRGELIGHIKSFIQVGESEVMIIKKSNGAEVMVPYLSDFASTELKRRLILLKESAEDLLN